MNLKKKIAPARMQRDGMNSHQFFVALPNAVRELLPTELKPFKTNVRSWLTQLYYGAPYLHYEVWNLGERRGRVELGLHFESKTHAENERLLHGFQMCLFEIKTELGESFEAEPWDKGWSKVYETIERKPFTQGYLEEVAERLAQIIVVLQPIFEAVHEPRGVRVSKR